MRVVALVGNKGGAGKTTLCVNLATALNARAPTVILDADPQRSSLQWRDLADRDDAVEVADAVDDVDAAVGDARARFDFIVIDCPPSVHAPQTARVLALCDVALVPVQPSPLDIWATVHIEDKVDEARRVNPGLRALLVINQLEPRTKLSQLMRQALAELSLPAATTAISRRVAYRSSVLEGRTVMDLGSRGSAAAEEITQLIEEVVGT
ncbi:MAG: ParA family protein [Chromatiaceae bacterium]|nr:ParA family protein [Gammaproteobacteria bacterium]MCP5298206.1 ParA family protein [Chromatiaceae bacterium]MCP5307092.1 ParA family protein [Chromatiaceae bacterium]MCP5423254.1 ParA family protein [Chromatiaceae bacterium]